MTTVVRIEWCIIIDEGDELREVGKQKNLPNAARQTSEKSEVDSVSSPPVSIEGFEKLSWRLQEMAFQKTRSRLCR